MTIIIRHRGSLFSLILFLLYRLGSTNEDNTDLFVVSPGDGEEFVYSPVGVNATIQCGVNSTVLTWYIDELSLADPVQRPVLHSRGIFQSDQVHQQMV